MPHQPGSKLALVRSKMAVAITMPDHGSVGQRVRPPPGAPETMTETMKEEEVAAAVVVVVVVAPPRGLGIVRTVRTSRETGETRTMADLITDTEVPARLLLVPLLPPGSRPPAPKHTADMGDTEATVLPPVLLLEWVYRLPLHLEHPELLVSLAA